MENNISCDDHLLIYNNNIPQDVLIQILVLLPVISLLRFKSVCKSWRTLIQTSSFIDLHLNTTTTTTTNNNFGTFIFQTSEFVGLGEKKNEAFMLSSSSAAAAGGGDEEEEEEFEKLLLKLEDIGYPSRYKFFSGSYTDHIFMVGSCNGLICIHDTKGKEVSLWNPATRQFRILPESIAAAAAEEGGIPLGDHEQDFVAFGYDVETNDYKVLLISHFRPYTGDLSAVKEYIFRVQVYSLNTDSWRLLEGINYLPAFPRQPGGCNHGVYLKKNGSYYFLGSHYNIDSGETLMLLSFDFTKQIFTTIQLPHDYHLTTILTSFGEKQLAVFAEILVKKENESDDDFETYDIWVLNEHHHRGGGGVKEEEEEPSWTKLHSMRLNCKVKYNRRTPRSISNNGEFALISAEADRVINGVHVTRCRLLQLFNLVTQQVQKEFQAGMVVTAEVYMQSLVSIGGNDTTAEIGVWDTEKSMVAQVNFGNNLELSDAIIAAAGSMLDISPITMSNQADTVNSYSVWQELL